jgi:hypothetical protein
MLHGVGKVVQQVSADTVVTHLMYIFCTSILRTCNLTPTSCTACFICRCSDMFRPQLLAILRHVQLLRRIVGRNSTYMIKVIII